MKNTLNRAVKYLKFKKFKSTLLVTLFIIVSGILLLSATLNSTISNYYSQLDNKNGISVSISPIINFNGGSMGNSDENGTSDIRSMFVTLSDEQLEAIKNLDYVSDVMQSTSVNVSSSDITQISYESTSSSESESNYGESMPGGNMMQTSGLRITGSTHLELENDFTNETVSLSSGDMPTSDDEIIISEALVSENSLKVGDSFSLENSEDTSLSKKYTVVGIYSYNDELDEMALQSVPENVMYTLFTSVSALMSEDSDARITNQFFIKDVDDFEQFKNDYFAITETSSDDYDATLNDAVYRDTIEPLSQLAEMVNVAKIVVLIVIVAILAIISYLMIKERTYEIGVLYSLSESKKNIVTQFITENVILVSIGFIIALVINMFVGSVIISSLMNMDLLNGVKEGAMQMGGGRGMQGMMPDSSTQSTDIESYLSISGIVQSYVAVIAIVTIITVVTIGKTLLKRPKEIISD